MRLVPTEISSDSIAAPALAFAPVSGPWAAGGSLNQYGDIMEPPQVEAAIPGAGNSHGAALGDMRDFRMSDKKLRHTTS